MQKETRIYAQTEIENEQNWINFVVKESIKISQGKYNAIFIVLSKPTGDYIDLVIINKEKICEICFT